MNQPSFLKQLLSLPKITLADLDRKSRMAKISKTATSTPALLEHHHAPNGVVDVKEPYYIDRYKRFKHMNCHEQGQCMACIYAKLHNLQSKNKWPFLQSKRNTLKQASQSRHNTQSLDKISYKNKEKVDVSSRSKLTKAYLIKVIKNKINLIDEGVKINFKNETGHESNDNKVVEICLRYFESSKRMQKQQKSSKSRIQRQGMIKNVRQVRNTVSFIKNERMKQEQVGGQNKRMKKYESNRQKQQGQSQRVQQQQQQRVQQRVQQKVQYKAQQKVQQQIDQQQQVKELENLLKSINNTNMTKLFTRPSFISMYKGKNGQQGYETKRINNNGVFKSKKNLPKLASINIQVKAEGPKENKNERQKNLKKTKKKVKILLSEESSNRLSKAQSIFSQLMIDLDENGEQNLGESVRTQLNQLSLSFYKNFKGILGDIQSKVMSHFESNEEGQDKLLKKIETATNWIKNCLSENDVHRQQKFKRLDKMLKNFKNIKGSKLKKNQKLKQLNLDKDEKHKIKGQKSGFASSSSKNIANTPNENRNSLNQQEGTQKFDINKRKKSSVKSKHTKKGENNHEHEEQESSEYDSVIQKQSSDSSSQQVLAENTEKLIEGQAGDEYEQESTHKEGEKRYSNMGKKNERKSSIMNKNIISKHTKSDELHWSQLQKEIENFGIETENQQMSDLFGLSKQKPGERRNTTHGAFPQIMQRTPEQQLILEKQKERERQRKKRYILRIKAAELLHKNEQTINQGTKALQEANLSEYIIHPFDSVLTQKKKIRYLKEIVRRRSENEQLNKELFEQIMEYLAIYEQSCNILIEASGSGPQTTKQEEIQNMRTLIGRKDIYNELLFYDLDPNYVYGGAEDEDINFTAKTISQDRGFQGGKGMKRIDLSKIFDTPKDKDIIFKRPLFTQQLVQVQLQNNGMAENYEPESFDLSKAKLTLIKRKLEKEEDPHNFSKIQQFLQKKRMQRRKYRKTCDESTMVSSIKRIRA